MLALLAVLVGTAQADAQPSAEIQRAVTTLAQCHGVTSSARAGNRAESVETIVAATLEACRPAEERVRQAIAAQYGTEMGDEQIAAFRVQGARRMTQAINEARGVPFVPQAGDEALVWRRCLDGRSSALARGPDSVDQIVTAARRACAAEERALRNRLAREQGEASANLTVDRLEADDTVRRRVTGLRATPR